MPHAQGEEAVELQALDVETEEDDRVEVCLASLLADVLCMAAPSPSAALLLFLCWVISACFADSLELWCEPGGRCWAVWAATSQAAAKQPLLPIVAAHARSNSNGTGTHNRSGSRTPSEVKNGVINKQLLKEPLSPPAGERSMCLMLELCFMEGRNGRLDTACSNTLRPALQRSP